MREGEAPIELWLGTEPRPPLGCGGRLAIASHRLGEFIQPTIQVVEPLMEIAELLLHDFHDPAMRILTLGEDSAAISEFPRLRG